MTGPTSADERGGWSPKEIVASAAMFERWWTHRDLPNDRRILKAAQEAGLLWPGGGLISLTTAGMKLRERARKADSVRKAAEKLKADALTRAQGGPDHGG